MTAPHPQPYRTEREARRAAYIAAVRRSEKPRAADVAQCNACGGWHVAATDMTATTPTGA